MVTHPAVPWFHNVREEETKMSIAHADTVRAHDARWPKRVLMVSDKLHRQFPAVLHGRVEAGTAIAQHPKRFRQTDGLWEVADMDAHTWFQVNGTCACEDTEAFEHWCKHRLAVNIFQRAQEIPDDELGGELGTPPPAPPRADRPAPPPSARPRFAKATKAAIPLRMALAGPSGAGKTLTALSLASALGTRLALIDTERGGARHYADRVDFDTLALTSFHPQEYIDALEAAAAEGYEVVIVDSLSHAWFGKDGALELVDQAAKRSKSTNTFAAWREVTPLHNKLVDALLASPCHVIVTLRSKMEYVLEADRNGKHVPRKVGLAPVQRDGLEYEFDVVAEMDQQHTLVVTKSRLYTLADVVVDKPGRAFGDQIHAALVG